MTILYIIDPGIVGGATRAFVDLVQEMKNNGIEIIVVTGKYNSLNNYLEKKGVKTIPINHLGVLEGFSYNKVYWPLSYIKRYLEIKIRNTIAFYKLKNKVNFSKIDIIHTNSARNDIGCYINKRYGIPHVMHIREFADSDFGCISFRYNYVSFYNKYTSVFVNVSNAVKSHWIRKGIDQNKSITIYDGVHSDDIHKSSNSSKYNVDLKIIFVGGVVEAKGQHLAIQALGILPEDIRSHLKLDIVGWSVYNYKVELEKQIEKLHLSENVRFLGTRSDVHKILGNYQIGLMCSRSEGFGLVTAEYMHANLGVIASDSGANPELITNNKTGLLFKSGDSKSLSYCIKRFYEDRDLLVKCSNQAEIEAKRNFTDIINASNILELYKKHLRYE